MSAPLCIAGTGTDIGKTEIACALIRALRAEGLGVDALKPVVSGFDAMAGSDPARLIEALGRAPSQAELARVAPWRFAAPLAANMAARAEGRAIDYGAVLEEMQSPLGVSDELRHRLALQDQPELEGVADQAHVDMRNLHAALRHGATDETRGAACLSRSPRQSATHR